MSETKVLDIQADSTAVSSGPDSAGTGDRDFGRDVLTLAGGSAVASALAILVSPVLTRLYEPGAFGTAAIFTSIVGIVGVIACLRYEMAILLPKTSKDAINLLALCLIISVGMTVVSALVIALSQDVIIRFLNAPDLQPYLWLIAPGVFFSGVLLALNAWNSRLKHFGQLSVARVGNSVGMLVLQFVAGLSGYATGGSLIGGYVFGSALSSLFLGGQIWHDDGRQLLANVRPKDLLKALERYRKFPLVDIWGILLNTISWQFPALLLSHYFTPTTVGYYALGFRVIRLPTSLIGTAIAQVFFQRTSELRRQDEDLVATVDATLGKLIALGLLPALVLGIIGKEIFVIAFGQNWAQAGIYVQILSAGMFFWLIASPFSMLFGVFERQELALIIHLAIFSSRFVSLIIGGSRGSVYIALGLFSGTGVLVYGGLLVSSLRMVDIPFQRIISVFLHYFVLALPSLMALTALKFWFQASDWVLALAGVVAAIGYYALVLREEPEWLPAFRVWKR
jgi:lipopolysaccharide exporter